MREKFINIFLIVFALILGITGTYYFMSKDSSTPVNTTNKNVTVTEQDSISESVSKIYDATVVVSNYQNGRLTGYGSGFVYKKDSKNGYIMTNNHVVSGASEVKVTLSSDEEVEAKVLGTDEYMDIAVLSISADKVISTAQIGDSSKSKIGDTIFTVGTPVSTDYAGTVSKGIISGDNRQITVTNNNSQYMMEVIQIDAPINPGNSGGPLANINGEVIGVNSVKLVENSIEGMGFSIPIEIAMSQVDKLEKGEAIDRPLIGITTYDVEAAIAYGRSDLINGDVKTGVIINEVISGGDAEEAGLKKGDIIVKIDDTSVKNAAHFKYLLFKHNIGDTVKLTVMRDGKEKDLSLKLKHKIGD